MMPFVLRNQATPLIPSTYPGREHIGRIEGLFSLPQSDLQCDEGAPTAEAWFGQKLYPEDDGEIVAFRNYLASIDHAVSSAPEGAEA